MHSFQSSSVDMAQVIQAFLPAYRQRYSLSPEQASVCQSIIQCQTQALGGEWKQCAHCGHAQAYYRSCGNRHCPRCKQRASEQWQRKQMNAVLPVRYYHLVFTLPHEFNGWCQLHPRTMYGLFFKAIELTLSQFSQQHRRFNGQLGFTCVLHTWGQTLQRHVHGHCLIPGIALKPDHKRIETTRRDYLYPIQAIKKVFRGKLVSLLRQACRRGDLHRVTRPQEIDQTLDRVMQKIWSVFVKPCLQSPETVIQYLSRYTYKIAISNTRLLKVDSQFVYFRWKDYADKGVHKIMQLDGVEFLRRFLLHVLPPGFMRIRHFGFLANCIRKARIMLLRILLKVQSLIIKSVDVTQVLNHDRPAGLCPVCHGNTMMPGYAIMPLKKRRR